VVLDPSAVVRIIEASPQGVAMGEVLAAADLVLAPELMLTQVANPLWRLQRAGQIEVPKYLFLGSPESDQEFCGTYH